ncbi:MAG: hypothetical protein IMF11_16610 [Proteobacteria bacterium]|jgi:hypothetical protein|nr:hypothetical protein [Pseudomonadota bacterium]
MSEEEKISIREEGGKLVIEVPKPADLSIDEMEKRMNDVILKICSGCTGVLHAVGNFI